MRYRITVEATLKRGGCEFAILTDHEESNPPTEWTIDGQLQRLERMYDHARQSIQDNERFAIKRIEEIPHD